jgi:hypothetical protein
VRRALILVFLLATALAACGGEESVFSTQGTQAADTSGTPAPENSATVTTPGPTCAYYDVEGCALYGLVLPTPLPTADALAAVVGLPGVPIALWRTTYTCVLAITMEPPGGPNEGALTASRFAYVDAEGIRQRRMATEGVVAPPITGLFISESYWSHWENQWAQAQQPGVLVEAIAVYLPATAVADGPPSGFRAVVRIPWRRTDSTDPSYTGELLLETEAFPAGYLSEPPPITCG